MARRTGSELGSISAAKLARRSRRMPAVGSSCVVALTTLPSLAAATRLARSLIAERLCACVNIVPALRSIYLWEGRIRDEREVLLIMKTSRAKAPRLQARTLVLHPYDVPEFIAWPVPRVAEAYGRWIVGSTS
jgi:periplasmic divalent cation tolerance protein